MSWLLEEQVKLKCTSHSRQARENNIDPHISLMQAMEMTKDLFCGMTGFVKRDYSAVRQHPGKPTEAIKKPGVQIRRTCLLCVTFKGSNTNMQRKILKSYLPKKKKKRRHYMDSSCI